MNKKDLTLENPLLKGFAKGYQATQAGGALGPDSFERGVKKFMGGNFGSDDTKEPTKKIKEPTKVTTIPNTDASKVKSKLPVGVSLGKYIQTKKGDVVSYKTNTGKEGSGVIVNVIDDSQIRINQNKNLVVIKSKDITQINNKDWTLKEQKLKDATMKKNVKEGLAELAQQAEHDHEVQMARADLYKIAKYAIKLHDMLKGISETEGLEGWQQAKITKASDYISSVYHNLDYDMKFKNNSGELGEGKSPHKKGSSAYKKQMAAKHANMKESNDPYKKKLAERLAKKIS
jgi:hypothetical protein